MEYGELSQLTPTVRVLGISVEFRRLEVELGRLDVVVKSWEIGGTSVELCASLLCVGFPAPLGEGEFGGVTGGSSVDPAPSVSTWIPSAGSWGRSSHCATETGSCTPTQGDGWGLPRPRRIL